MVEFLLQDREGVATIAIPDLLGDTPLHAASRNGDLALTELLLRLYH
jgi:ankyrin repeat protein